MKRLLIIGITIILLMLNLKAAREITNMDIAHWYLDSDLVLICTTSKTDTIFLKHHESNINDSVRLTYDMIREVYRIDIDSIIKPFDTDSDLIESILSQDFSINYSKSQYSESLVYKVNESGDTIGVDTMGLITMFGVDYSDNSYFRLQNDKQHLVILSLTEQGFVIDYETEISAWILELIAEVADKGQAYIDDFFKIDKEYNGKD
jgi:hypothetical protein